MVAFHIAWWPVYRYGLFYGVTFVSWYLFLERVGRKKILTSYSNLQNLLTTQLDTVVLLVIGAILIWWRLWHVFLYERWYYSTHLGEIIQVRQGGMSFIGGVIGVILVLIRIRKHYKLSAREFMLLGDLVLCIVPLWIFLGRVGNYLNKELYGLPIDATLSRFEFLVNTGLAVDYKIDETTTFRINTNIIQSLGEWLLTLIVWHLLFLKQRIRQRFRPGLISGRFFIVYAVVRFCAEYLKELPVSEIYGWFSVSQWLMFWFFAWGVWLVRQTTKKDER